MHWLSCPAQRSQPMQDPMLSRTRALSCSTDKLRQFDDSVKPVLEVAGVGIGEIEKVAGGGVGAQRVPIRQVGGDLQHVAFARNAGQLQFKDAVAEGATGEIN